MFGFGFGKKTFIGVDVGTSAIKMIELKIVDSKPFLSNYAWMPLGKLSGVESDKLAHFDTLLPKFIKRMYKEAGFKGKDVHISLPAFGGLITIIDFPQMARRDMEQAIEFEAHKYIPTSLDEVVLSWDTIEKNGDKLPVNSSDENTEKKEVVGKIKILLVAASRNKVEKYEKLVKNVGLKLNSIELESFSMTRSLVGNDPGNFIIVDIGSRICNIILVEKGIIRANRNIDAGGKDITRTIASSLNIEEMGAERLKLAGKNFFAQESYVDMPALELIIGEVSRIINSTFGKEAKSRLDGVILSGGTANLTGINEHFTRELNVKTINGNPFSRIGYDKRLEPVLSRIGSQFSVCAGLALKGIEKN